MKFHKNVDVYVPDGMAEAEAAARVTHLAIAAHQDDIELMAYHGVAACFGRRDLWFGGVTVTDGAGSPRTGVYQSYTDSEMTEVRKREQRKAALIGEYGVQFQLGYTSREVKSEAKEDVKSDLLAVFKATRPETVYLHNPFDKHDTHVAVLLRTLEALRELPAVERPRAVLGCEVWRGLDWVPDEKKIALDTSAYPNLSRCLTGVFDSQISGGKRYDLAAEGRRTANATYYASHACDESASLQFAVDLAPLLEGMTVEEYAEEMTDALRLEVLDRIKKVK